MQFESVDKKDRQREKKNLKRKRQKHFMEKDVDLRSYLPTVLQNWKNKPENRSYFRLFLSNNKQKRQRQKKLKIKYSLMKIFNAMNLIGCINGKRYSI